MTTQPEIDRMARVLSRELAKLGFKLKHLQAVALVTKILGNSSLNAKQARTRKKHLDAATLASEHATSLMFQSTGRYGVNTESFFEELNAAFALQAPEDVDKAVKHIFEAPHAPRLLSHIEAQYRLNELHQVFKRFEVDSLRLIDRTLFESRNLASPEPEVLFQGPLRDWRVQEGYDLTELSDKSKEAYEGKLIRNGSQFRFTIAPVHLEEDELQGLDQLAIVIEVHEGRPCLRVTSDIYGEQVLTVYGTSTGTHVCFENDPTDPDPTDIFAAEANTSLILKPKA